MEHILFNLKTGAFLAEPVPQRWVACKQQAAIFDTKPAAEAAALPAGTLVIPVRYVRKGLA